MFKKEKIKSFVLGAMFMLLITSFSTNAFAQSKVLLEVVYNNIKLVVNGRTISLGQDSKGVKIEPFIYNGTTYLPVRAVGEALNKNVDWIGATQTVVINDKDIVVEKKPVVVEEKKKTTGYFLENFKAYDYSQFYWTFGSTSESQLGGKYSMAMGGEKYYNGFKLGDPCYAIFNLDRKVNKISGLIGLDDFSNKNDTSVQFIGDGKILKEFSLNAQVLPEAFSVDVTGVRQLTIQKGTGYSEIDFAEVIYE